MGGTANIDAIDFLSADRFSALGDDPLIIANAANWQMPDPDIQAVCIGIDSDGKLPSFDPDDFDVLLTTAIDAPAPWVSVPPEQWDTHIEQLKAAVRTWPMAATIACRVLRIGECLPFSRALDVESFAYSTLLGGAEFERWLEQRSLKPIATSTVPLVLIERQADVVTLTLNHPNTHNAMTAEMRDALYAALANILDDPTMPTVMLQGAGKCFSTGGALPEFGTATDLAQAHHIRTLRSCTALFNRLGPRVHVQLHGACIGSGLEVAAAAAYRTATATAWFQLPELHMGLIPGAGGTKSVAQAIGRHRTAWMLLSGKRIDARRAHEWRLVHEIIG
jgi:hypothetical protein